MNRKPLEAGQGAERCEHRVAGSTEHGGPAGGWAGNHRAGRLRPGLCHASGLDTSLFVKIIHRFIYILW